jgi:hypothetical protein
MPRSSIFAAGGGEVARYIDRLNSASPEYPGGHVAARRTVGRCRRRCGRTGWRYVVEEVIAAGFQAYLAEPADTQAAPGRKRHANIARSDWRLLRDLLADDRSPASWNPPTVEGRGRRGRVPMPGRCDRWTASDPHARRHDIADQLPELEALSHLGVDVVLDGELVADAGRPAGFHAVVGSVSSCRRDRTELNLLAFDGLSRVLSVPAKLCPLRPFWIAGPGHRVPDRWVRSGVDGTARVLAVLPAVRGGVASRVGRWGRRRQSR